MCGADSVSALADMSVQEFSARVLGQYLDAALRELGSNVRIIDYQDINAKSLHMIAEFFGLPAPMQPKALDQVLKVYSKDPKGRQAFSSDKTRKQSQASKELHTASAMWAAPQYAELRSTSAWR